MLREKLKYAIHFCKSIDTDDYARIALTAADGGLEDVSADGDSDSSAGSSDAAPPGDSGSESEGEIHDSDDEE